MSATATRALPGVLGGDLEVPLASGRLVTYTNLDYAASAPALTAVADHVAEVIPYSASVHRGAGYASQVSTSVYENARGILGEFVGARRRDSVIFTRNTTDALSLLASAVPGPTLFLDIEHHANLLPWQARGGIGIVASATVEQTVADVTRHIVEHRPALLAVTGASNFSGETLPIRELSHIAHDHGVRIAVDGAQLLPHRRVDMIADGIDYLVFSGHKLYAPYGAGALIGRGDWLDDAEPYLLGGGAVERATLDTVSWVSGPARHEAGSPNVVGVAAMARAAQTLASIDTDDWYGHEQELLSRLLDGLAGLPGVRTFQLWPDAPDRLGVVPFALTGIDSALVASYLSAEHGIGVRHGKFCVQPLFGRLGIDSPVLRASVGLGTRVDDVDRLIDALRGLNVDSLESRYYRLGGQWLPNDDQRTRPEWAPLRAGVPEAYGCASV